MMEVLGTVELPEDWGKSFKPRQVKEDEELLGTVEFSEPQIPKKEGEEFLGMVEISAQDPWGLRSRIAPTQRVQIPQGPTQIQQVSEEEGWAPLIGKSAMAGLGAIGTGLMGARRAMGELAEADIKALEKMGINTKGLKEISQIITGVDTEGLNEIAQIVTGYWTPKVGQDQAKKYAAAIVQSTITSVPMMLTGPAALPLFGVTSGGQKYLQMRDAGKDIKTSLAVSIPVGISEAVTEKLPLDVLRKAGTPVIKRLLGAVALELPGEEINTVVESIADKLTIYPDMTWEDYWNNFIDTAVVTIGQTLLTGGIGHMVAGGPTKGVRIEKPRKPETAELVKKYERKKAQKEEGIEIKPVTPEGVEEVKAEIMRQEEVKPVEVEVRKKKVEKPIDIVQVPSLADPKSFKDYIGYEVNWDDVGIKGKITAVGDNSITVEGPDKIHRVTATNIIPVVETTREPTELPRGPFPQLEVTKPETLEALNKLTEEVRVKLEAEGRKMPEEVLREKAREPVEEVKPTGLRIVPGRRVDWMEPRTSVEFFDETIGKMKVGVIESIKSMPDGTVVGATIKSEGKTYTPRVDDITGPMKEVKPTEEVKPEARVEGKWDISEEKTKRLFELEELLGLQPEINRIENALRYLRKFEPENVNKIAEGEGHIAKLKARKKELEGLTKPEAKVEALKPTEPLRVKEPWEMKKEEFEKSSEFGIVEPVTKKAGKGEIPTVETPKPVGGKKFTEIDASKAKYNFLPEKAKSAKLSEILDFPELYEYFPELKNYRVRSSDESSHIPAMGGEFTFKEHNTYTLYNPEDAKKLKLKDQKANISDLLHEIQHWIQNKEGRIGSTRGKTYEEYYNHSKEVQARDAASRKVLIIEESFLPKPSAPAGEAGAISSQPLPMEKVSPEISLPDILRDESGFIDVSLFGPVGEKLRTVVIDMQNTRIGHHLNFLLGRGEPGLDIKFGPKKHLPGFLAGLQNMETVMSQTKEGRNTYEAGREFKGNMVRDFRQWRHIVQDMTKDLDADEKLALLEILDTQEEIEGESGVERVGAKVRNFLRDIRQWAIDHGAKVRYRDEYFPHVFQGKFWVKEEGEHARKVQDFDEALQVAKQVIERTGKKVSIVQDTFIPPDDATLLNSRSYWRLVNALRKEIGEHITLEEGLDVGDINKLLREEKIARPKPKQRFFGNLLPRLKNNPNFMRDIDKVLDLYTYGLIRKVHQDIFLKKAQKNLEAMPVQDDRLKKFIENVYMPATLAHPTNFEENIAKVINKFHPGTTGPDVRRMFHNVNLVQYVMDLGISLTSATANATQFWVNAYPIVGELSATKGYAKGLRTFRDPELHAEVDEMNIASGVSSITGQPLLHGTTLKDFIREITFREGIQEFQSATLIFFQGAELMNRFGAYWAGKDYALKQLEKGTSAINLVSKVAPKTSSLIELGQELDDRMKAPKKNLQWVKKTKAMQEQFAKRFGFELNDKTNFRVGRENLPQLLNNMPIRIFSPYKSFLLNQLKYTFDTIRPSGWISDPAKAVRFTGMTLLLAGVAGNPLLYGMFLFINQLSKWLFDKDLKKDLIVSKWIKGLTSKLGIDISGSLAVQLPTRAYDLLGRFGKLAYELGRLGYEKGKGLGTIFTERKLARQALPAQVQRTVDALRILKEGQYITPIRKMPIALNEPPWSAAIKRFLGALPTDVGEQFSIEDLINEKKARFKSISTDMTERWATAVKENDTKEMEYVITKFSQEVNRAVERMAKADKDKDQSGFTEALTDFLFWDSWHSGTPKFKEALIRKTIPRQVEGLRRLPRYMRPEALEMQTNP